MDKKPSQGKAGPSSTWKSLTTALSRVGFSSCDDICVALPAETPLLLQVLILTQVEEILNDEAFGFTPLSKLLKSALTDQSSGSAAAIFAQICQNSEPKITAALESLPIYRLGRNLWKWPNISHVKYTGKSWRKIIWKCQCYDFTQITFSPTHCWSRPGAKRLRPFIFPESARYDPIKPHSLINYESLSFSAFTDWEIFCLTRRLTALALFFWPTNFFRFICKKTVGTRLDTDILTAILRSNLFQNFGGDSLKQVSSTQILVHKEGFDSIEISVLCVIRILAEKFFFKKILLFWKWWKRALEKLRVKPSPYTCITDFFASKFLHITTNHSLFCTVFSSQSFENSKKKLVMHWG